MDMIINGDEGFTILPESGLSNISIEARGDLDLFSLKTCSRDYVKEKAWNVTETVRKGPFGWIKRKIKNKRKVVFNYKPTELENKGNCPLMLSGLNKLGNNSWGYIDIDNKKFTLKGKLLCNGYTMGSKYFFDRGLNGGTSMCQGRSGTIQAIYFINSKNVIQKSKCDVKKVKEGFEVKLRSGYCTTIFKDTDKNTFHKLVMYGYDESILRE